MNARSTTVDPDPDRFAELVTGIPSGTPVTMLNLLRFREVAEYDGAPADCSGSEAYLDRYSPAAYEHVRAAGGDLVWSGQARGSLIGPPDEQWDLVLLVRYPSIEAFVSMVTAPAYLEIAKHRTAALADSRLVATVEG